MKYFKQTRLIDTWVIVRFVFLALLTLTSNVYSAEKNVETGGGAVEAVNDNSVENKADAAKLLSVEELKKKVIRLNRDLFILEEDLLFPANTQFTVFLSLDSGKFFKPDSVILTLDDEVIASHLYTQRQLNALAKGGMQRLHIGNLKNGQHELSVVALGQGTDGREVKRAASLQFEKEADIASFEIMIRDQSENYQADVEIVKWDN